ncbi:MAG: hypothetical protein NVSMB56_14690 [Pyrinomonadaceae bacterium]
MKKTFTRRTFRFVFFSAIILLQTFVFNYSTMNADTSIARRKTPQKFDPEGSFFPKGDAPKGLAEIGGINLFKRRLKTFTSEGSGVNTTNGITHRFKTLSVTREKLIFTTVTRRGISYSFEGRFLKDGVYSESDLDNDTVVLEGHMTKLRNGQKIADANMRFTYFGGT